MKRTVARDLATSRRAPLAEARFSASETDGVPSFLSLCPVLPKRGAFAVQQHVIKANNDYIKTLPAAARTSKYLRGL
jgi:hypothetical protein